MTGALDFDPYFGVGSSAPANAANLANPEAAGGGRLAELAALAGADHQTAELLADDLASDEALAATERAAIEAEGEHGDARAEVAHHLPVSWADSRIEPTAGGRCRNCGARRWWREAEKPKGWRCADCHPASEGQAVRVVAT